MQKWIGKTAVVTGAGSGIGEAIAEALAREGLIVAALDVQKEKAEVVANRNKNEKGKIVPIACDVTNMESINKAFAFIENSLNGVDILINCAGVFNNGPLLDLSKPDEYYLQNVNVDLNGYIIATRRAYKTMQNKNSGYIINICSTAGHQTANRELVDFGINVYGAAKHGVNQLSMVTRTEIENAGKNIRVTNLSPGTVWTNIDVAGNFPQSKDERMWQSMAYLMPKDIADQVVYLLGLKENIFISQMTVEPKGGMTLPKM